MNRTILDFFFVLVFVISSATTCRCQETVGEGDFFDIDKIVEYNSLIGCFSSINLDFQSCNNWAKEQADKYLETFEGVFGKDSEAVKMAKCCGVWIIRDCWLKSARQKCPHATIDLVKEMPSKFMPQLASYCQNYTDGHLNCRLPIYLLIGFVFCIFLLIVSSVYVAIALCRRRQAKSPLGFKAVANNNGDAHV